MSSSVVAAQTMRDEPDDGLVTRPRPIRTNTLRDQVLRRSKGKVVSPDEESLFVLHTGEEKSKPGVTYQISLYLQLNLKPSNVKNLKRNHKKTLGNSIETFLFDYFELLMCYNVRKHNHNQSLSSHSIVSNTEHDCLCLSGEAAQPHSKPRQFANHSTWQLDWQPAER